MYFSEEELEKLEDGYLEVPGKSQQLSVAYITRKYSNDRAREFAVYGFARRLKTLARCIENTFTILPPDRVELPESDELHDAAINIQAFVLNVFGSLDDLAWTWVNEKGLQIHGLQVGLNRKNKDVRGALSKSFREYLEGLDDSWFKHLKDFRDALAHRIPLYIPPYVIPDDQKGAYDEIGNQMRSALEAGNSEEYDRLAIAQKALAIFCPWVKHSFEENAAIVNFHPQLLADFNTVEELGSRMLDELNRVQLPRFYEIRDQLSGPASPTAFFQDFESTISESLKNRAFVRWESDLQGLDGDAWDCLRSKTLQHLTSKDSRRGWEQLFALFGEAHGYNFLKRKGCSNIKCIPANRKGSGKKTPDWEGLLDSARVLCEVKTINRSDDALRTTDRCTSNRLEDAFFNKLDSTIVAAMAQLAAHDANGEALKFVYINVYFDDWLGEYKKAYFEQIDQYLAAVSRQTSAFNLVFYNDDLTAFHEAVTMQNATVDNAS